EPRNPANPGTARPAVARRCRPAYPPTGPAAVREPYGNPHRSPIGRRTRAVADLLDAAVRLAAVVAAFLLLPLIVGQMEHKVMAHMQSRLGPMYAGGFHGWAQLIAGGGKFAQKEDVIPAAADRRVFGLPPGRERGAHPAVMAV